MLVLSRKADQRIHIGPDIIITILRIDGNRVSVGICAPKDVAITRPDAVKQEPPVPV